MAIAAVGGVVLLGGAATAGAAVVGGVAVGAVALRRRQRAKKLKKLRTKLFEQPFDALEPKYMTNKGIPVVVASTIHTLKETAGAETEGIFRVPGSASRINFLADVFRKGTIKKLEKLNLKLEDPHDVGGLFKLYLRLLPEPLCTNEKHQAFLDIQNISEKSDRISKVSQLITELPTINQALFRKLLKFFAYVSSKSELNKMHADNMSIVFAPTLFARRDQTALEQLGYSGWTCKLLTEMIESQEEICKAVKPNVKMMSKTIHASTLFRQQDMVTAPITPKFAEEYNDPDDIAEIEEILQDVIIIGDSSSAPQLDYVQECKVALTDQRDAITSSLGNVFAAHQNVPMRKPPVRPNRPPPRPPRLSAQSLPDYIAQHSEETQ